jgi:hypothetical protein
VAGAGFTDTLQKRRKLVIAHLEKTKSNLAASRISTLPPSTTHVFGDNVEKIKQSLKLSQLIKQREVFRKPFTSGSVYKRGSGFKTRGGPRKDYYPTPSRRGGGSGSGNRGGGRPRARGKRG